MSEVQEPRGSFTFIGGEIDLDLKPPPTLESFYQFCGQRKLMGVRCESCEAVLLPPRMLCPRCGSSNSEWVELKGTGELLTYSVIHVAPATFQPLVPYAVGIVALAEGARLPGIIRVRPEDLRVGLELKIAFEPSTSKNWPSWPRYFFVRADTS